MYFDICTSFRKFELDTISNILLSLSSDSGNMPVTFLVSTESQGASAWAGRQLEADDIILQR